MIIYPAAPGGQEILNEALTTTALQALRARNARQVLDGAWSGDAFTASDAMTWTGLTRSTVIGVCDDLVGMGWLNLMDDARVARDAYTVGRPARRYRLRDAPAVVMGVDAGHKRMLATVADLQGRQLGTAVAELPVHAASLGSSAAGAEQRRALARQVMRDALASCSRLQNQVLAVTMAVPAPVDDAGLSPRDVEFWQVVNPGMLDTLAGVAHIMTLENDANMAAVAESDSAEGRGRDADSFIALLAGERVGAGLMINGRLVRGRRGGAGEMRILDHVEGVGSADGMALLCRTWATQAIRSGTAHAGSPLGRLDPDELTEVDVARAAESGDLVAAHILERLAQRLARICLVVSDLLDVDLVVVAGSAATSFRAVIDRAAVILDLSDDPAAPELTVSRLGDAAVAMGAAHHALNLVRQRALEFSPPPS